MAVVPKAWVAKDRYLGFDRTMRGKESESGSLSDYAVIHSLSIQTVQPSSLCAGVGFDISVSISKYSVPAP